MHKFTTAALAATLMLTVSACGKDAGKDKDKVAAKDADKAKSGDKAKDADKAKAGDKAKDADKAKAPKTDPAKVVLTAVEAFNKGDYDGAMANMTDDFKATVVGGETIDKAALRKMWEDTRQASEKMTPTHLMTSGNTVVMAAVVSGTHAEKNKPFGAMELWLFDVNDKGQFSSMTGYMNTLAMPTQLGEMEGLPPVAVTAAPTTPPTLIKGAPNPEAEKVVKGWQAAWSDGSVVEKLDQFLAADSMHVSNGTGEVKKGVETAKKEIPEMMKAFSDVKVETKTLASAGNFVFVTGVWSGKHTGDMGPMKATNKEFSSEYAELFEVKDGKITASWEFSNPAQFMGQLGLLPEKKAPEAVAQK